MSSGIGRAGIVLATLLMGLFSTASRLEAQVVSGLLEVPVRLCALEGSPTAQSPSPDDILLARLRSTSSIWLSNGTGITFRSALYPKPGSLDHLPKIVDLCWQGGDCPGNPGDVLDSTGGFGGLGGLDEMKVRFWACAFTWDVEYPDAQGILVINIRNFVNEDGSPSPTVGAAPYVPFHLWFSPEYCASPRVLSPDDLGTWAFVTEGVDAGNPAQTAAHELGHDLLLAHGDGLDNDCNSWPSPAPSNCASTVPPSPGPRLYDDRCDSRERDTSISLMSDGGVGNNTITAYQAETARAAAVLAPGVSVNPHVLNWGETFNRTFLRTHTPNDIVGVRIADDIRNHELAITLTLFGPLKSDAKVDYWLLADTDDNPRSGVSARQARVPTRFRGADLVLHAIGKESDGKFVPEIAVWTAQGKKFSRLDNHHVGLRFTRQAREGTGRELFDALRVSIPDDRLGKLGKAIRIQMLAMDAKGKVIDRLPDSGAKSAIIPFIHSSFVPSCLSDNLLVRPGETATVTASGLGHNREIQAFLDSEALDTARTDGSGVGKVSFRVPETYAGLHAVSIQPVHAGLTAVCSLSVKF